MIQRILQLAPYILLAPHLLFVIRLYYNHAGGFSFGDEWTNFMAGFFMVKGKILYGEIFYNHQMLMAYISFVIQKILQPENLYQLALYHRMFILLFSLCMGALLVYKFRFVGFFFVFLYELTKFYIFGHLFLAESMVVYVIVYMFGLVWERLHKKEITSFDLVFSGVGTWFVVFSREPYIPLVVILYFFLLFGKLNKTKYISMGICLILSLLSFIPILKALPEFFYQDFIFTLTYNVPYESSITGTSGFGILKGFIYPVFIFFGGKWNHFRYILIGLDIVFLGLLFYNTFKLKKFKSSALIVLALGLAGIRFVFPGTIYYEAFHLVVWYGLFITVILFLLSQLYVLKQKKAFLLFSILLAFVGAYSINRESFIWEKIDKQAMFTQNYAHYYINGEVIRVLSSPGDKLFADMWDPLIHFQAGLDTDYKYSIYSFSTAAVEEYNNAKLEMFQKYPPDFYYTFCPKEVHESKLMPQESISQYVQLYRDKNPSCTYVHKSKMVSITPEQWVKVAGLGFYLPK